ncbi:PREDICTED: uncharacterized protein LOC101619430 [Condylura cristata]|uniref:uncharacterized protein LOC101619430 n=1 Tax=Condylura cristata TaxID=143302 RepID=UPI00033462CF|nr:PREDICTED: uncharacterized protein LOC101619430 [Condylura cristata]
MNFCRQKLHSLCQRVGRALTQTPPALAVGHEHSCSNNPRTFSPVSGFGVTALPHRVASLEASHRGPQSYHNTVTAAVGDSSHAQMLPAKCQEAETCGPTMDPEGSSFLKEAIRYLLCTLSREDLRLLLTEAQAWAAFVAEAHLSREEAEALCARLSELRTSKAPGDDRHQQEQECRALFASTFPQLKDQLEPLTKLIGQLRGLAGRADKVHRYCAITNVVARCTSGVSGAMTIAGLILASFTAGVSVALTGTGLGLGFLSAGIFVITSVVEHEIMSSIEAEANRLESGGSSIKKKLEEDQALPRRSSGEPDIDVFRGCRVICALRVGNNSLGVTDKAIGRIGMLAQIFLGIKSKVMGIGALALGVIFTVGFLVLDMYNIKQDSEELVQGAKSESGEKLRQKAQYLHKVLEELKPRFLSKDSRPLSREQQKAPGGPLRSLRGPPRPWDPGPVSSRDIGPEEPDSLRAKLSERKTIRGPGDNMSDREQKCRAVLLKMFPPLKDEIEKLIGQIHWLADWANKVHRDCAIAKVAASTSGVVSGVTTIVGCALAPFTAGASLAVTATGLGLGVLSAGTSVTTSLVEQKNLSSIQDEIRNLESSVSSIKSRIKCFFAALQEISENSEREELATFEEYVKRLRELGLIDKCFGAFGQGFARAAGLAQLLFGATAKEMGKAVPVLGGIFSAGFIGVDVVNLVRDSKELHQGTKSELGEKLREHAQNLEKLLEELNSFYKSLQRKTGAHPQAGQPLPGPQSVPAVLSKDSRPLSRKQQKDNDYFLENSIVYILDTLSNEDLHKLLSDAQVWEEFVAEAVLSRDEADVIYDVLSALTDTDMEDKNEQEFRKHFLKTYPQMRQQLEEYIAQLYELAARADKVHRDCIIANVVANSTTIVSGILTIVGLSLAPVTAGASLALTATGVGLGTAATVTTVSTSIVEQVNKSSVEAKANTLSAEVKVEDLIKDVLCDNTFKIVSTGKDLCEGVGSIMKNARAIRLVQAKPHLARASCLTSGGKISAQSAKQVEKAFEGTALAMNRGARILGTVTTGVNVLIAVARLVQNSKDLHEGAKTESAENLRQKAQELQEKLEELNQVYENLL